MIVKLKTSVVESCRDLHVQWFAFRVPTCEWMWHTPGGGDCTVSLSCSSTSYMFDEPSSYLDVKQRLNAALAIRNLLAADR